MKELIIEWLKNGLTVSAVIAFAALVVSIYAIVNTNIRSKKDRIASEEKLKAQKKIDDERFKEQKAIYEERIRELNEQREQDRREADERNRFSEQPYLVFKGFRNKEPYHNGEVVLALNFLNKGRGAAYSIVPAVKIQSSLDDKGNQLYRCGPVNDPIALVEESIELECAYFGKLENDLKLEWDISYEDASGRKYKQTHKISIHNDNGESYNLSYAIPELIKD